MTRGPITPAIALLVLLIVGGCPTLHGPEQVLDGYLDALERGDGPKAWSEVDRAASVPAKTFRKQVADVGAAGWKVPGEPRLTRSQARWGSEGQGGIAVVRGTAGWHILEGPFRFYQQDSPEATLRTFATAYRRSRYDVLLMLVPEAERVGLTEEQMRAAFTRPEVRADIEVKLALLAPALTLTRAEVEGDTAMLRYGPHRAVLRKETGGWKLVDL